MLDINLLPWRDFLRAQQRRKRMIVFIAIIAVALLGWCLAHRIVTHEKGLKDYMLTEQAKKLSTETYLNQQLGKIKLVGYLSQDKRRCAMLLLPSGEVLDVQADADVGVGDARVVSVSAEKVVLVLPDNRLVTVFGG